MATGSVFTRESAQRIARQVRRMERNESQPVRRYGSRTTGGGDVYRILIGKTSAAHAKSAAGDVALYSGNGAATLVATGDVVSAWNRFADIDSGKWVALAEVTWGYEIIAAEC